MEKIIERQTVARALGKFHALVLQQGAAASPV